MLALHLIGHLEPYAAGLQQLLPMLHCELKEDGYPIIVTNADTLTVTLNQESGQLGYNAPRAFFRGLGLICQHIAHRPWRTEEQPLFEQLGAMVDCSRNAVPTVEGVKLLLNRMALMGFNMLMLYTEDTYTVPERPRFGYLRGRYTPDELREIDQYALALGIEIIPCIQTLGHMGRALRWPGLGDVSDTGDVLLVDSEDTYRLLEEMIVAITAPLTSKRVHIGMDEAYSLGRGRHLDRWGWEEPEKLMRRHLARVHDILQRHGLHGMMWSDMHFHLASASKQGSYPRDCVFTQEILDGVPKDMDLIYWDYYTEDAAYHRQILRQHQLFEASTAFAGGIFTWLSPVADLEKTLRASLITLDACRECGVSQVIATMWGDDGAEGNLLYTGLYGLNAYAEYCWHGSFERPLADERFQAVTGCDAEAMWAMDRFNHLPGLTPGKDDTVNPVRQLLYEDPLMPLFERDFAGMILSEWYRALAMDYARYAAQNPAWADFLTFCRLLAEAVAARCALRECAPDIIRGGDRAAAGQLPALCDQAILAVERLAEGWQRLWMSNLKPNGYEVIDLRLGGVIQRLKSAKARFSAWAAGSLEHIPEMEEEKLPLLHREDGTFAQMNSWAQIASPTSLGF